MSGRRNLMIAGGVQIAPIDGETGVWLKQGATVVSSAMRMTGATVISGQSQYVYSRGIADMNTIESAGIQYVSSAGKASNCVISSGGSQILYPEGLAVGDTITSATVFISGGTLASSLIGVSGFVRPGKDSFVDSITLSGYHARLYAYGGTVTNVDMQIGFFYMFSDRSIFASSIVVGSATQQFGVSAGYATDITAYALVRTYDFGIIDSVTAMQGGKLQVSGGTMANAIISSGGTMTVSSGGVASQTTVLSGGIMYVSSGASALAVTSNFGATITVQEGGYIEYVTP